MRKKLNSKKLSLLQNYTLRYTITGGFWIIYSTFHLFDSIFANAVAILALIGTILSQLALSLKTEAEDEMSKQHLLKAKSLCLDIVYGSLLIFTILSMFVVDIVVVLKHTYGFFIGAINVIIGLLFVYFEKAGD